MRDRTMPRSPAEELIYQEVEAEVRDEYAAQTRREDGEMQARARLALSIVTILSVSVGMPILALVAGGSLRLFRWASGLW